MTTQTTTRRPQKMHTGHEPSTAQALLDHLASLARIAPEHAIDAEGCVLDALPAALYALSDVESASYYFTYEDAVEIDRINAAGRAHLRIRAAAVSEVMHCHQDHHIRIRTTPTSTHKICNTRARIEAFAAIVRKSPALFGGGKISKPAAALKARQSWKAGTLKVFRQLMDNKQFSDALRLAEQQLDAIIVQMREGPQLLVAPSEIEGWPGMAVYMTQTGRYSATHTASGLAMNPAGWCKTRAAAAELAAEAMERAGREATSRAMDHGTKNPVLATRAEWMRAHNVMPEDIEVLQPAAAIEPDAAAAEDAAPAGIDATAAACIEAAQAIATAARQAQEPDEAEALAIAGNDDTHEATAEAAAATLRAAVAECVASLQEMARGIVSEAEPGPGAGAPHGAGLHLAQARTASASLHHGDGSGHGHPPRQCVSSRSGAWHAEMWRDHRGAYRLDFERPDGGREQWEYSSQADRMRALQAMARAADAAAEQRDTQDDEPGATPTDGPAGPDGAQACTADHASPAPVDPMPADGAPDAMPPTIPADGPELDDTPRFQTTGLHEGPQDLNHENGSSDATATAADLPEPFRRAEPFHADPRDMLAMTGAPADALIGLGIRYTGDLANAGGRGAVTAVNDTRGERFGDLWLIVTLEDGRTWQADPLSFSDSIGSRLLWDCKRHGAPYLAQLAAAVATRTASNRAAKDLAALAREQEKARLLEHHPDLIRPGDSMSSLNAASKNLRALLKKNFPGVKFSVRSSSFSGGSSIDIRWTDGPTRAAVDAIADQFSQGSFNGMEDIYEYSRAVWPELFGGAKYVHSSREFSDQAVEHALITVYGNTADRPTVEDFRRGRLHCTPRGDAIWPTLSAWAPAAYATPASE
jgi:hypothetical protein